MEKKLMLLTMVFVMTLGSCHAQLCSNVSTGFRTNLITLLDLLTKTAPLRHGFYETSVGNNSDDRVYGVVQCKPNISSTACANCLNTSTGSLGCEDGSGIESLSSFCTAKFSDENFFGEWNNFSSASYGEDGLDDPLVFSKGFSMMERLATTVPDQPLMFQSAVVNVGENGKRYGLSQCSRDLSKSICRNCLEDRLVRYRSYVENRSGWEILGISCSMWYVNHSVTDSPVLTGSATPSQSQIPPPKPTLTSESQRCYGAIGVTIRIGMSLSIGTLTFLAVHVFQWKS